MYTVPYELASDYKLPSNFLSRLERVSGAVLHLDSAKSGRWGVAEYIGMMWAAGRGLEMLTQVAGHGKGHPTCVCLCPNSAG